MVEDENDKRPLVESIAASKSWKKGHKSRHKDVEVIGSEESKGKKSLI